MDCHKQFKSCARLVFLAAISSLLPLAVHAQGKVSQEPAESDAQKNKPSLELRLRTLTPMACIGSKLELEIEIINTGRETVRIERTELWSSFLLFLYRQDSEEAGMGEGWGSGCDHCGGNDIVIEPGATYWDSHELLLRDSDFLKTADKFTLSTEVHSIWSNGVIFELYDCGKPQEAKEQK